MRHPVSVPEASHAIGSQRTSPHLRQRESPQRSKAVSVGVRQVGQTGEDVGMGEGASKRETTSAGPRPPGRFMPDFEARETPLMPHAWSPSDWVLVLGAVFAGLVSVITAWKTNQTKKVVEEVQPLIKAAVEQSRVNEEKIDQVHDLTNGNLGRAQAELDVAKRRVAFLERLLATLADECRPGAIEQAKLRVEAEQATVGKRRKADLLTFPAAPDLPAGPPGAIVPDSPERRS